MPFSPGQSGNPKGRPKKGRALTDLLEKALDRTVDGPEGKRVARKRLLAERIAEAAATGFLPMGPGDAPVGLPLAPKEWRQLVQWLYAHIDGSKVLNEHSGPEGEAIPFTWATPPAESPGDDAGD